MAAWAGRRRIELGVVAVLAIAAAAWVARDPYAPGRQLVSLVARDPTVPTTVAHEAPVTFRAPVGAPVQLALEPVARGFEQPTDLQFVPGSDTRAIVLEKRGRAHWLSLPRGAHGALFTLEVRSASEEGLLGLAFHPQFAKNGRFFVNYVAAAGQRHMTRIAEWHAQDPQDIARCARPCMRELRVLLEVEQPFPNHNAGQLAFGPDGYLYIGLGDGGAAHDPYGHGQDPSTWLGSMLRVDVDRPAPGRGYGIPQDNPFVGKRSVPPETWAYGLRNPWRYSFDPKGRLIVADVGQSRWEEVSIVQAGDNLGWDLKEGFDCMGNAPACSDGSLVDPVCVYGRELGVSITGGFVYTGTRVPLLQGKYVFGDFGSGRLFALELPDDRKQRRELVQLGQFAVAPSSFGRDAQGELYLLDFAKGVISRLTQTPRLTH
jgi:glucose/arabinose dehydrogenase